MVFSFLIDSDIQYGHDKPEKIRNDKINNVEFITNFIKNSKNSIYEPRFLMITGDLTEHCSDGKKIFNYKFGGITNEMTPLINEYLKPMSTLLPLKLIPGNHDFYIDGSRWPFFHKPVLSYIRKNHNLNTLKNIFSSTFSDIGDVVYSFDIEDVHFCACDIYPNEKVLKWLRTDLEKNNDKRIIIFQHYNFDGPYSDWWTMDEKKKFYDVIKNYNVVLLIEGHHHFSSEGSFMGIKTVNSGGRGFGLITVYPDDIKIKFIKKEKDTFLEF